MAAKWLLKEPGYEAARKILFQFKEEQLELIAPNLLVAEVCSALVKRVSRQLLLPQEARKGLAFLLLNTPVLSGIEELCGSALELATAHRRSFYDCVYLALALRENCELVTADERFGSLAIAYPQIRFLGEWQ